jgi:hypothetical protein
MRSLFRGFLAAATVGAIGISTAHAATMTPIYSFCSVKGCQDGGQPEWPITIDSAGALYGTTIMQSKNGITVYKLTPASGGGYTEQVLHTFCYSPTTTCKDGTHPQGRIVVDPNGVVYGATSHGSGDPNDDEGVFYSVTPEGVYTVLYRFCPDGQACNTTGTTPVDGLTYFGAESGLPYDGKAPLYGVMLNGGQGGSVFRLNPPGKKGGWTFTNLLPAPPAPPGGLITSTDDKSFYMLTTQLGGGGIYKLTSNGGDALTATQLSLFCDKGKCPNGSNGDAFTIDPAKGTMFGVTNQDAAHKQGAVWTAPKPDYTPLTDVHDFCTETDCADGMIPGFEAMSRIDTTNVAYGVTQLGGKAVGSLSSGTLFQVGKDGQFSTVYTFCSKANCADGYLPVVAPTPDYHGHFFGTTIYGGDGKYGKTKGSKIRTGGVVYELTP